LIGASGLLTKYALKSRRKKIVENQRAILIYFTDRGYMKIQKILSQHRRDFRAIYQCEHCDHETPGTGYDDSNFHQNVIPDMQCNKCGKKAPSDHRPLAPKYPDGMTI